MSKQRAKGTAFETAMLDYQQQFFPELKLYRPAMSGANDIGDICGIPGLTQELKNHRSLELGEWAKEAHREHEKAQSKLWWILHKRRGVGDPGMQWVTMPHWVAIELIMSWGQHDMDRGNRSSGHQ